jgi:hypothetical protein
MCEQKVPEKSVSENIQNIFLYLKLAKISFCRSRRRSRGRGRGSLA